MVKENELNATDIPTEVAQAFLALLGEKNVPPGVVKRLQGVLLADKKPSRKMLNDALFTEDPLP